MTPPMATEAATEEPEIMPKKVLPTILVWARPPGMRPTNTFAALISFCAMPPEFINTPHRMKNGTAINEKLSTPETIFWHATNVIRSSESAEVPVMTEAIIMLMETGTLSASSRKNDPISSRAICKISINQALLSLLCCIAFTSSRIKMRA